MSSTDPYQAPKTTAVAGIRLLVVLVAAGSLLLAQGLVYLLRRLLADLGMLATPLDLVTLAAIVGASAGVSTLLRRGVQITRRETALGLAGFAVAQVLATVFVELDSVVSGQINVLQVGVVAMVTTVFASTGVGVGRLFARGGPSSSRG